jgi:propanol-preferring alcohol dehydrogenase
MKAMVVKEWGQASILDVVADPKPGPGEAVLKVRAAGVGLTLLNMRNGSFGGKAPRIMGHELAYPEPDLLWAQPGHVHAADRERGSA